MITTGVLAVRPLSAYALWQEAEKLSRAHTPAIGVRTLDLLHVAAARVLKAARFCTFDTRQHALARAAGLKIN
jgi:predicted nucleic acid-binding protein